MKHNGIEYPFEIHPLSPEDGGGYAITFPDLPGCASDGATPEEALRNGRDALESWLKVAREFGDVIPPPLRRAAHHPGEGRGGVAQYLGGVAGGPGVGAEAGGCGEGRENREIKGGG